MLPTTADGTPLCQVPELRREPHAWVKLWKHHAAQPEADRINALAAVARRGVAAALRRPDLVGVVLRQEPPDPRRGAGRLPRRGPAHRGRRLDRLAADRGRDAQRLHGRLQGDLVEARTASPTRRSSAPSTRASPRSSTTRCRGDRPPGRDGRRALGGGGGLDGPAPGRLSRSPTSTPTCRCPPSASRRPGRWSRSWARAPATWCSATGSALAEGMCGVVEDGIIPGLFGYEAGQSAVGDIFAWFIRDRRPAGGPRAGAPRRPDVHHVLERDAAALPAGRDRPARARLVERQPLDPRRCRPQRPARRAPRSRPARRTSTGRCSSPPRSGRGAIIESLEAAGVAVDRIVACGGLPERNELLMQISADITGREFDVAASTQAPAVGSAMYGAVAAGAARGGYDSIEDGGRGDGQTACPDLPAGRRPAGGLRPAVPGVRRACTTTSDVAPTT